MIGHLRGLWCRLRRRHRVLALVHDRTVLVGCAAC
jgi:hypothetical protein